VNRSRFGLTGPLLLSMVLSVCWGGEAFAAGGKNLDVSAALNMTEQKVTQLMEKLQFLQKEYGEKNAGINERSISIERRTNEGQVFFFTGDYVRAAIIFYDLVENPKYAHLPGQDERIFYLAESMFKNRNYLGARKYYMQLADKGPSNQFFFKVLPRLVTVAASLDEYMGIDKYFAMLENRPRKEVGENIYYIHAKSLFDRGKLKEADKEFSAFPDTSPFARRARYFRGVIAVSRGPKHYKEAIDYFRSIASIKASSDEEKSIKDLAKLAEGRVLLEMGKIDDALDAYQAIDRFSPYFAESLYEIAWSWIREANNTKGERKQKELFNKALSTIDILLAALPEGKLLPKVKLLKGDLLLRLQSLNKAERSYNGVIKQFEPVKLELEKIIAEHEDPKRYFHEIMGSNLDKFDVSSFLPPLAVKWAKKSDRVKRALLALKDLKASKNMLQDAERIAEQLKTAAEESSEQGIMPRQKEAREKALALNAQALDLKRKLAEIETEILLRSRIKSSGLAKVEEENKIVKMQRELPELGGELEAISVLLKAAAKWCSDTEMERGLSKDEKKFCRDRVFNEMKKLKSLGAETEGTKNALKKTLANKGLEDWVRYEDARAKRRRLEKLVQKLPKTVKGLEDIDREAMERLHDVQKENLRLGYELDSMLEQLKAIERWRRDTYSKRRISEKHEKEFKERIARELTVVKEMKGVQKEISDKLNEEITKVSVIGTGGVGDNQAIRASYEKALVKEKELFHKLRRNLDPDGQRKVAEIDALRSRLEELNSGVREFLAQMEQKTGKKAGKLASEVDQIGKELEKYMAQVKKIKEDAEMTAGSVAYASFKDVREQFYKLVLRADVGLIDVAWARTESQNKKREELVKKKSEEMRALYQKYQEITEELQ